MRVSNCSWFTIEKTFWKSLEAKEGNFNLWQYQEKHVQFMLFREEHIKSFEERDEIQKYLN